MKLLGGLVLFLLSASSSFAEVSVADLMNDAEGRDALLRILELQSQTIEWTNTYLEDHKEPLYCPPRKVGITGSEYYDMTSRFITANPQYGAAPAHVLSYVLLSAMIETYPCKK